MLTEQELSTLHFECQQCGYCCAGEAGYILLTEEDLREINNFLQVSRENFIKEYSHWVRIEDLEYLSIKEDQGHRCIFLDVKNNCKIYHARPTQCKTYPFWPRIVKSFYAWKEEGRYCPGIGKGALIDPINAGEKIILERLAQHIKKEKDF